MVFIPSHHARNPENMYQLSNNTRGLITILRCSIVGRVSPQHIWASVASNNFISFQKKCNEWMKNRIKGLTEVSKKDKN